MKEIEKLFQNTEVVEIKNNLKTIIKKIENEERKNKNKILEEVVKEAKKKEQELHEEYNVFGKIYFYPEPIAPLALLVEELVIDSENKEDMLESLKFNLNNYFKQFKDFKANDWCMNVEEIQQLINILEIESQFFSILKNRGIQLNIFSLPVRFKKMNIQQTNYNEIKNNKFAIQIFHTQELKMDEDVTVELFFRQFGFILKELLVGASQKAPDGFIEIYDPIEEMPLIDEESKECMALFADTFAHYIVEKMEIRITNDMGPEWKKEVEGRDEEFVKRMMDYFDDLFKQLLEEREEWDDNEKCPCGSNKKYKDCCKKRKLKYYKEEEGHYSKAIPMHPELEKALYDEKVRFRRLFGRSVGENDYVTGGVLHRDLTRFRKLMKREKVIDKAWLYASEKMDGLMLTEENQDLLPERDVEEFKKYIEEYRKLMRSKVKGQQCNLLQAAEATNTILEFIIGQHLDDMIYVLNLFVNSYSREKTKEEGFYIDNIKDFLVFCAYKCSLNMTVLKELVEQEYYDNAMAVVRFIYEILIQVRAYKNNPLLFKEKILSVAGLEKGTHIRVDKNIIKDMKTEEIYHYKIQKSQLAQKAGENYEKIHETLYQELSGFIHLDAVGAKKIFQENDMFFDIDECLMAGFIGMVFALEIIIELIDFEGSEKRLSKDIQYFSNKLLKEFLDVFPTIIVLDDKEVYKILEETLKEYKTDYKINYQRSQNCEVL